MDTGLAAFAVSREQIGFLERGGIDALAGVNLAHRLDPVTQARRRFKIQRFGRIGHFLDQAVLHVAAFAVQEIFRLHHQFAVCSFIHPPDARRAAALDLKQQAGPRAGGEHRIRTGAQQKSALQCVEGAGDGAGAGERPEIGALGAAGAAMLQKLREGVIFAQQDIGKAFVVAVRHIIARLELLDEIALQQQCFAF